MEKSEIMIGNKSLEALKQENRISRIMNKSIFKKMIKILESGHIHKGKQLEISKPVQPSIVVSHVNTQYIKSKEVQSRNICLIPVPFMSEFMKKTCEQNNILTFKLYEEREEYFKKLEEQK